MATLTATGISGAIGSALGPVGAGVGAAIGALAGATIDAFTSAIQAMESDVFPPQDLSLFLESPNATFNGTSPDRLTGHIDFQGHGGHYRLFYEWRFQQVRNLPTPQLELPNLGVFFRGEEDALTWRAYSGGRWHGEEVFSDHHAYATRLGGSGSSPDSVPALLHNWMEHRLAVFFRGTDGLLHWKVHHGGRWHRDAVIEGGGSLASHPCVARDGVSGLSVFYRGPDNWLVWLKFENAQWHGEFIFNPASGIPTQIQGHTISCY